MQINSNFSTGGTDPVQPKTTSATAARKSATDSASFPGASALDQALAAVPNSRPEVVARAKALVADPNYPSGETLKQLSSFLAAKLISGADFAE
jgi:hypothetical protein